MQGKKGTRKPVVSFCDLRRPPDEIINISSQNGAEGVVTQMLPKSHIRHVILNANVSEERFLDMKLSSEDKMQKKSRDVHDHIINTFLKRLERKQNRWMKEDNFVCKNLNLTSSPCRSLSMDISSGYPDHFPLSPQNAAIYMPAKYPYSSISHGQTSILEKSSLSVDKANTLLPVLTAKTVTEDVRFRYAKEFDAPKPIKTDPTKDILGLQGGNQEPFKSSRNDIYQLLSWQSRATTSQRPQGRRVAFKFQDDRFESLMLHLSPVWNTTSFRRSLGIVNGADSPSRITPHQS